MSKQLIQWNEADHQPPEELDDSMLPQDPPGYVPAIPVHAESNAIDEFVQDQEQDEEQEEQDDAAILSNARMRLEQGRLYEMLMITDIFKNLDADAQAIKNVQREIKRFAKERMEVMLGMKKPVEEVSSSSYSPFSSLQIDVLKSLATKLSGGASDKQEGPQPAPKSTGLTPISKNSGKTTKVALKSTVSNPAKGAGPKKPAPEQQEKPGVPQVDPALANQKIEDMTYDEKLEYNRQKSALYDSRKTMNPDAI